MDRNTVVRSTVPGRMATSVIGRSWVHHCRSPKSISRSSVDEISLSGLLRSTTIAIPSHDEFLRIAGPWANDTNPSNATSIAVRTTFKPFPPEKDELGESLQQGRSQLLYRFRAPGSSEYKSRDWPEKLEAPGGVEPPTSGLGYWGFPLHLIWRSGLRVGFEGCKVDEIRSDGFYLAAHLATLSRYSRSRQTCRIFARFFVPRGMRFASPVDVGKRAFDCG